MIILISLIAFFCGYLIGKTDKDICTRTNNRNTAGGYTPIYDSGCRNCINYMNTKVCKDCPLVEEGIPKIKPGTKV